jgi:hypothetical protein
MAGAVTSNDASTSMSALKILNTGFLLASMHRRDMPAG